MTATACRTPVAPCATLPMYDWPEVREATDALWTALRDALQEAGVPAPERLTRERDPATLWEAPELVLGQTCGMPYVSGLRSRVSLLGTPDYAVPGCDPGWYRSVLVVRADDPGRSLAAWRHRRWAYNDLLSQSGYQALLYYDRLDGQAVAATLQAVCSGSHRESLRMVAADEADLAAIDYVSWRLACRHLPEAGSLRVLDLTPPTPGLPYIAGSALSDAGTGGSVADRAVAASVRSTAPAPVVAAIDAAIGRLPTSVRGPLGLHGFWRSTPADYDLIIRRRV